MPIKMTDGLVTALKDYLTDTTGNPGDAANLDLVVDEINTLFNDAITLEHFCDKADIDGVYEDDPDERARYPTPSVNIVALRGTIETWKKNSYASGHQDIVFWIVYRNQDRRVLRKALYRYVLAVWECVVDGFAGGATGWTIGIGQEPEFDFSETLTRDNYIYADARLVIRFAGTERA